MSSDTDDRGASGGALDVLVVGATGSIGSLVVPEALRRGHRVRALVRDPSRAAGVADGAVSVVGDLTSADGLAGAVSGVSAVVLVHGAHGGAEELEAVDYGAVRSVLDALRARRARDAAPVRVALMTAIGVTRRTALHDWKRRGERLLRASGLPYTVVRPGWFDLHDEDQHHLVALQGDDRRAGDPSDGVVARRQLAQVLVAALTSPAATRTTFELVAERGPAQEDLEVLFAGLRPDPPAAGAGGTPAGGLDGVLDAAGLPLDAEPERVRADLRRIAGA